jgi:hypothetical protein
VANHHVSIYRIVFFPVNPESENCHGNKIR